MGDGLEKLIISAVDATFSAESAKFRCSVAGEAGRLAVCEGAVDFRRSRSVMDLQFMFPGPASVPAAEVHVVTERGTVYVHVPSEPRGHDQGDNGVQVLDFGVRLGMPERWIAFHDAGFDAFPIGALAWLRGVVGVERVEVRSAEDPSTERYMVDLDLEVAVRRSPEPERNEIRSSLERSQLGLAMATTNGEVEFDLSGRVRWLQVSVPPGISPWFFVATGERSIDLELYAFDASAGIIVPEADVQMAAGDFLSEISLQTRKSDLDE